MARAFASGSNGLAFGRRRPAVAGGQPADRRLPVRPQHLLPAFRRPGRLWLLSSEQADLSRLPPAPACQPRRGHPRLPASLGAGQREGDSSGVGSADGQCGYRRPKLLSPELRGRLAACGAKLLAHYYHKGKDPDRKRSARLSAVRYRIETSNGRLAVRYRIKRTWAKDLWHLCHRVIRKILSHIALALINLRAGHQPMQLDALAA
jgi:hypothetical protein